MPFFSVVIPSFNHADLLPECVQSVQSQTDGDWELVIVDDASTDGSLAIAQRAAQEDSRIHVLELAENSGLHRARCAGVGVTTGDFVLFLDADDSLEPGILGALRAVVDEERAEERECQYPIVHFGLRSVAYEGTADSAVRGFHEWANVPAPPLSRSGLLRAMFLNSPTQKRKDWNVHHRLFEGELCRQAFAAMSSRRLERAEDAYEMLVIAAHSCGEITRNDIVGYRYNMGAGITSTAALSSEQSLHSARQLRDCVQAAAEYAAHEHDELLDQSVWGMRKHLAEAAMNEWYERVPEAEKITIAEQLAHILGADIVATALMRFARDRAYAQLQGALDGSRSIAQPLFAMAQKIAREAVRKGKLPPEYAQMKREAEHHMNTIEHEAERMQQSAEQRERWEQQDIRIFVSAHKEVALFESDILQPVQVGAAAAARRFSWAWHDDSGVNISERNPEYSELTTQYWAWKNVNAEYYGFCHYRRYFDFSAAAHPENDYGEVMERRIDAETAAEYELNDAAIARSVQGWDIITSPLTDMNTHLGGVGDPLTQWKKSPLLIDADFQRMIAIVREKSPEYAPDLDTFLGGHEACFCNMFIMRKEIFHEYCAWLFPLLDEYMGQTNMEHYSVEARRTPGHLSERLLNVFLIHAQRMRPTLKVKQLQCVHFEQPERRELLKPLPPVHAPIVPVVLAADNVYVPQLATTVFSLLANASPDCYYDLVILHRDITWENQEIMRDSLRNFPNFTLRFVDAGSELERYGLSTNNAHISVETYYRFLIPDVLPFYDKVLYLDSDMIVLSDVAELFATDLQGAAIGAVRDIDFAGNLNVKHGDRARYAHAVLHLKEPFNYFQAGVLIFNTAALRAEFAFEHWMELAADDRYIYNDQDVLNSQLEGRVHFLPAEWNVMHNVDHRVERIFSQAPAAQYREYQAARSHPKIIHYAGYIKPWNVPTCDFATRYWEYARQLPFYEALIGNIVKAQVQKAQNGFFRTVGGRALHHGVIRQAADVLLPAGTHRRAQVKRIVAAVKSRI
ncbi:MAG: DUF4422 domain-containing protein [Arcanobacterium sp.]|nr:DUF4422 domain-containing protein [Arcanobacterium sp.]